MSAENRGFIDGLPVLGPPWSAVKRRWFRFLKTLPPWLSPWVRDIVDVCFTVAVIIVVLKVLFGADMLVPLVVVTSESMVHVPGDQNWSMWLIDRGLDASTVGSFPLQDGFGMGDMIVVRDPDAVLGDVIIYERDLDHLTFTTKDPIIHRVVGVAYVEDYNVTRSDGTLDCHTPQSLAAFVEVVRRCQVGKTFCPYTRYPVGGDFRFYITKGDHNDGSDQCNPRLNIAYPVNEAQVTGRAFIRIPYLGWPKLILNMLFRIVTLQF